jgi:hypothetical protein
MSPLSFDARRQLAQPYVRLCWTQYGDREDAESATPAIASGSLLLAGPWFVALQLDDGLFFIPAADVQRLPSLALVEDPPSVRWL